MDSRRRSRVGAYVPETGSVPVCRKITYVTDVTDVDSRGGSTHVGRSGSCGVSVCPGNSTFVTDVTDVDRNGANEQAVPYLEQISSL